jgi:hypothetical protein
VLTETSFSFPRSWAFLFRAFYPTYGGSHVSKASSAPTLSKQTFVQACLLRSSGLRMKKSAVPFALLLYLKQE